MLLQWQCATVTQNVACKYRYLTSLCICDNVNRRSVQKVTSCTQGPTLCPRPCKPHAAAQLIHALRPVVELQHNL